MRFEFTRIEMLDSTLQERRDKLLDIMVSTGVENVSNAVIRQFHQYDNRSTALIVSFDASAWTGRDWNDEQRGNLFERAWYAAMRMIGVQEYYPWEHIA